LSFSEERKPLIPPGWDARVEYREKAEGGRKALAMDDAWSD